MRATSFPSRPSAVASRAHGDCGSRRAACRVAVSHRECIATRDLFSRSVAAGAAVVVRRQVRCQVASTVQVEASASAVNVSFKVQQGVKFGEVLKVVGGAPQLGDWSAAAAPAMEWSEGDNWSLQAELEPGTYSFKCVIYNTNSGSAFWEEGGDRKVEVGAGPACAVQITFGDTSAVEVEAVVEEAAEEPAAEPLAEEQSEPEVPAAEGSAENGGAVAEAEPESESDEEPADPSVYVKAMQETLQEVPQVRLANLEPAANPQASVPEATAAESAPGQQAAESVLTGEAVGTAEAEVADDVPAALTVSAALVGLVALPVVAWSEYTLLSTGCGLPPGPGGSLGAVEGLSYVALVGITLWSVARKLSTGRGLPAGPAGMLGAVEGLSYLTWIAGIGLLGLQVVNYGYIPSALPDDRCFAGAEGLTMDSLKQLVSLEGLRQAVDVDGLMDNVGGIKDMVDMDAIRESVDKHMGSLKDMVAGDGLMESVDKNVESLKQMVDVDALGKKVEGLRDMVDTEALKEGVRDKVESLKEAVDVEAVKEAVKETAGSVEEMAGSIKETVEAMVDGGAAKETAGEALGQRAALVE